ncbi:hypothetical protein ACA910_019116 [Epithemia clementina (nom. ined.)]
MIQYRSFFTGAEWFEGLTFWGHSGTMLKLLHGNGAIPYWACFALLNLLVRMALFPVVVYGAHASHRFGKVIPEVQFLMTLFLNDLRAMQRRKAPSQERMELMRINLMSLSRLYKNYQVNPWSIFLSPLLQIPFFWYFSIDLRKIVNGLDPNLAQELVDADNAPALPWITDLTEPDAWFGLPILCGLLLYVHMEVAMGSRRNALGNPAAHKANSAILIKDIFQCLAIFMPCCTSQMAAGMQVYLTASFTITLIQSELLRTATVRSLVGLPPLFHPQPSVTKKGGQGSGADADASTSSNTAAEAQAAPTPPKYALRYIRLKQFEQEAIKLRGGDGPLLGFGVLYPSYQGSLPGTNRPSTIMGSSDIASTTTKSPPTTTGARALGMPTSIRLSTSTDASTNSNNNNNSTQRQESSLRETIALEQLPFGKYPFIHGVTAPLSQQQEQAAQFIHLLKKGSGPNQDSGLIIGPSPPQKEEKQLHATEVSSSFARNEATKAAEDDDDEEDSYYKEADDLIEKANRGERPDSSVLQVYGNNISRKNIKANVSITTRSSNKKTMNVVTKKASFGSKNKSGKKKR